MLKIFRNAAESGSLEAQLASRCNLCHADILVDSSGTLSSYDPGQLFQNNLFLHQPLLENNITDKYQSNNELDRGQERLELIKMY